MDLVLQIIQENLIICGVAHDSSSHRLIDFGLLCTVNFNCGVFSSEKRTCWNNWRLLATNWVHRARRHRTFIEVVPRQFGDAASCYTWSNWFLHYLWSNTTTDQRVEILVPWIAPVHNVRHTHSLRHQPWPADVRQRDLWGVYINRCLDLALEVLAWLLEQLLRVLHACYRVNAELCTWMKRFRDCRLIQAHQGWVLRYTALVVVKLAFNVR